MLVSEDLIYLYGDLHTFTLLSTLSFVKVFFLGGGGGEEEEAKVPLHISRNVTC